MAILEDYVVCEPHGRLDAGTFLLIDGRAESTIKSHLQLAAS
jgi:hypothetical protein